MSCICSAVDILETVAGALAVNEEIEENEEVAVVLNFKGEMSALCVERVSEKYGSGIFSSPLF